MIKSLRILKLFKCKFNFLRICIIRTCERSGSGRFGARPLKRILRHTAPCTLRSCSIHFQLAPLRSHSADTINQSINIRLLTRKCQDALSERCGVKLTNPSCYKVQGVAAVFSKFTRSRSRLDTSQERLDRLHFHSTQTPALSSKLHAALRIRSHALPIRPNFK